MTFESPIEEAMWLALRPDLGGSVAAETQAGVTTQWGSFRLDILLQSGTERVAVECDGAEFHNKRRDEWRDAAMLGSLAVSTVYRFPGWAITHRPADCLYFMALHDPWLFSDRALHVIRATASSDFVELCESRRCDPGAQIIAYRDMPSFADTVSRRSVNPKHQFWRELYRVLLRYPSRPLDEAMRAYDLEVQP